MHIRKKFHVNKYSVNLDDKSERILKKFKNVPLTLDILNVYRI